MISHAFLHGLQLLGWRGFLGAQTTTLFSSREHFNSRPWRSSATFSSSKAVEDELAMTMAGLWTEFKTRVDQVGVRKEHHGIESGMCFIMLILPGCNVERLWKVVIEQGRNKESVPRKYKQGMDSPSSPCRRKLINHK